MRTITFRWLVRQLIIREPRFGETRDDVVRWGVFPYLGQADGIRIFPHEDVPFSTHRSLQAAHAAARHECERRYGRPAPQPRARQAALGALRRREHLREAVSI